MDPDKDEVFSDPEETSEQEQGSDPDQDQAPDSDPDSAVEEEEKDGCIFNTWMHLRRGENEPLQDVAEPTESRSNLDPTPLRMGRRASLPSPSILSSMTLSRLHVSTAAPVTAKLLLRRSSSRRLLPSPQEVPPPPAERERRSSLALLHGPPTIPERPAPQPDWESNPQPKQSPNKPNILEKKGHFRRRNVMSLSDADSVCLICHNELKHGTGGTRELQCSHSFHKECIEEYLWRKQQCPTCHVQVSLPQNLLWTSTLKVP
ncbi:uncharacterized protein [Eucyclogobius newberryi]|uniref:uncharacterized protein n=1 Tax=Eucyclogobius newberryi TaxID=166745 RepID=UPI003B5C5362